MKNKFTANGLSGLMILICALIALGCILFLSCSKHQPTQYIDEYVGGVYKGIWIIFPPASLEIDFDKNEATINEWMEFPIRKVKEMQFAGSWTDTTTTDNTRFMFVFTFEKLDDDGALGYAEVDNSWGALFMLDKISP